MAMGSEIVYVLYMTASRFNSQEKSCNQHPLSVVPHCWSQPHSNKLFRAATSLHWTSAQLVPYHDPLPNRV